ncbi:hypothetical protein KC19_VG178100 [Ceratodon purpureus]|uniref:Uncharacterized protein n=1 Tax=Ceratodon purpureus TaxID=3225 RepID=A0A8T0HR81_CERPU|nr:hypothetical protein KC19_VG178100 [Ceratodon purpureus]
MVLAGKDEDRTFVADAVADNALEEVVLMDLDAEASGGSSMKSDGDKGSSQTCSTESEVWSAPLLDDDSDSVRSGSTVSDVVMFSPPGNA